MCGTPSLHARDVHRVPEVPTVLWLSQPSGLTGDFARVAACSDGTEALTLTVTMVWIKILVATQTLALS
jgi:hypothetical protein